ncbi:MAG TPA: UvrD-helicase domain-containing protein [Mycobacteriales bacterium]|nr:UvrD-helicase domain-containing protein [Mycobacteriales bacterium]
MVLNADDAVVAAEVAAEQAYLDRVNAELDAAEERARGLGREAVARGALGTDGGIRLEDLRGLYESDVFMHNAVRRRAMLGAQRDGVLFGRLDYADGTVRYVGRLGVRDDSHEPLVLDWRAPAAEAYYRATPMDPHGVVRRRTITSTDRHVTGLDDDLLDATRVPEGMAFVGDGALLSAMAKARDGKMGTIVATIQADQDAAVRAPATGTTVISGGPGTGKTVVALHRVAYLLFTDRRRFEAGGVLVVGPSAAFVRYIDRVLPSLGEESVVLKTLGDLIPAVSITRPETGLAADLKGSDRLLPVLRRAVHVTMPRPVAPLRVRVSGTPLTVQAGTVARVREEAFATGGGYADVRAAAERALLDLLWAEATRRRPASLSRAEFADAVRHDRAFGRYLRATWEKADPKAIFGRLRRDRGFLDRCARGLLDRHEVDALAESWARPRLTVPDVAVVDELLALTGQVARVPQPERDPDDPPPPPPEPDEYAHVVVDEAQELTAMQWRMVARRGPRATWTIVGDDAQSALPDRAAARAAMAAALPEPRHEHRLGTNYRNPSEIFALAVRVLGAQAADADLPVAARSSGREPEVRHVAAAAFADGVERAVRDLRDDVAGSVAVIVAGEADAAAFAHLADERVRVLTALECKGLEFDGVVVAGPERIAAPVAPEVAARTLYVVLTRATRHLVCVTADAHWPA